MVVLAAEHKMDMIEMIKRTKYEEEKHEHESKVCKYEGWGKLKLWQR